MIEILDNFNILENYGNNPITSFHLAEGPGGFIEALATKRENSKDQYYGMTLIEPQNNNVPGWKKSEKILEKYKNIVIESGVDNKGDLYNKDNLEYCFKKHSNKMDIITADGGFDFSIDFNKQEAYAIRLIFSQIAFAISMQKQDGCFILKIFDLFLESTIDLVYLLSSVYKTVYITKPNTSRTANSERYLVCKGFRYAVSEKPYKKFYSIFDLLSKVDLSKNYISKFFKFPIPYYYINRIEECNAILGQQQIENINFTISLIDNKKNNEKLEQIKKNNIQKCIIWCSKHNLSHYKNYASTNIFLNVKQEKDVSDYTNNNGFIGTIGMTGISSFDVGDVRSFVGITGISGVTSIDDYNENKYKSNK
tara:strand:+ start:586 stop:1683 length:1098 start_codon:yes stop_codon:yes gene_type:complete